jgi:hypothetical protein
LTRLSENSVQETSLQVILTKSPESAQSLMVPPAANLITPVHIYVIPPTLQMSYSITSSYGILHKQLLWNIMVVKQHVYIPGLTKRPGDKQ